MGRIGLWILSDLDMTDAGVALCAGVFLVSCSHKQWTALTLRQRIWWDFGRYMPQLWAALLV